MNKKSLVGIGITSLVLITNSVVAFANNEGIVTASTLNVRSGPSTSYSVQFKINKNVKVTILETKNNWHKISYNGKIGWASADYIKIQSSSSGGSNSTTSSNKETTANVNLRTGAGTSYSVILTIPKGKTVKVVSTSNGWDKVEYSGKTGYVSNQYLKIVNNSSSGDSGNTTTPESVTQYKVTASTLNVRSGASTSYSVIGKLSKDNIVDVVSISNKWAKIKYNNSYGYCSVDYLTKISSPSQPPDTSNPPTSNNYLDFQYKLQDGKDNFVINSTSKVSFTSSYLTNPNRLVIDFKDAQLKNNIPDQYINKTFIKTYRASSNSQDKTSRLVIEFAEGFDKNKIKINQNNNAIQVTFDQLVNPDDSNLSDASYLNFEYEAVDNKDTMKITSDTKIKYNYFYLTSPSRLVMDFENTKLENNISDQYINKTFIKTYRASSNSQDKTSRLVIEFEEGFDKNKIKINQNDKIIQVLFDEIINPESSNKPPVDDPSFEIKNINRTFEDYINGQQGKYAIISKDGKFVTATIDEVKAHANPYMKSLSDIDYKFQFLKLNKYRNIDIIKLNTHLNSLSISSGKTNIFKNQADAFSNSAKKYSLDPLYFVAHTILETGNGCSALAQGHEVELDSQGNAIRYHYKDKNGNLVYGSDGKPVMYVKLKDANTPVGTPTVTVYNLFGIGAVDSAAIEGGTTKAYDNGWTSIEKAIDGGAQWLSSNYLNSTKYPHQNTLYSMRWDYVNNWHQYSTDVGWAIKIGTNINKLSYIYTDANNELNYIFPNYK